MKKTIYVLPKLSADMTGKEFHDQFMANWELAATIDYVPDSIETLRAIEYSQIKVLMCQNEKFFNAVVGLCADMIADVIEFHKEYAVEQYEDKEINESEYEAIQAVSTLDDLLNSGCLGSDYEDSKDEFVSEFMEMYPFSSKD